MKNIHDKKSKRKVKSKNHLKHQKTEALGRMRKIRKEALLAKHNLK